MKHFTLSFKHSTCNYSGLLILLSLLVFSCKEEVEEDNDFLYANIKNSSDQSFNYIDSTGSISASPTYYAVYQSTFSFGSRIYDEAEYLQGTWKDYINIFDISFRNISFDEIQVGSYDFYNQIIGEDTVSSGIEILWMTSFDWEEILVEYRKTEEYLECMSRDDFDDMYPVCNEFKRGYHDFYKSANVQQESSYFKITKMYSEPYEVWNPDCYPSEFLIDGIIIEGFLRCNLKSSLCDIGTETISGNFKLQLANYPQRYLCEE